MRGGNDPRMQTYAIDASYVLAFLLPDEIDEDVARTFARYQCREIELISTTLLPFEVMNGLLVAYRKKRIHTDFLNTAADLFTRLHIPLSEIDHHEALAFAHLHALTVYDAGYAQLAAQQSCVLLTKDAQLLRLS